MITLAPLPRSKVSRVAHLLLPDSQSDYVGQAVGMTADPDILQDFVEVTAGLTTVGFFKIDHAFERRHPELPVRTAGLRGLLIGGQFQRRGHGRATLGALPGYLERHHSDLNEIFLSVHAHNNVAISLYRAMGWMEFGDEPYQDGRSGPEQLFRLPL